MTLEDIRGVPVSTTNRTALAHYERAAELCVGYYLDPVAAVDEALTEEPDLAIAHCLKAGMAIMSTEKGALPMLSEAVTALERLGGRLNQRERGHAAAARAWLDGDFERSVRLYGDVLLDHPRDLLALQIAHIGDFCLGATQMLRDRVAQVIPHWSRELPGHGFVLGMYAFGLEQTMSLSRAEDTGRQALELNARDPWAVHAVAHVMETQGRLREGIDWLEGRRQDWSVGNGFAFHNWWHMALFHLDLGEHARALAIYDAHIRPGRTQVAYENVDASALLWRLALRGVDVGGRWQSLADDWQPMSEDGFYAFNDVHAVMAFVGAGRISAAERTVAAMERRLQTGGTNKMMTAEVGLPLARALVELGTGAPEAATERLLGVRALAHRMGGSNAQRDIIHLTLIEAAVRAGRAKLARALCAERTELKPRSPFNWTLTSRVLESAGQPVVAKAAAEQASLRSKAQRSHSIAVGHLDVDGHVPVAAATHP